MCGIAGAVRVFDGDAVRRMTRALAHRGPDAASFFEQGEVALGFRRLAIIDPRTGQQPIESEDGRVVVICNGEIYNYLELRWDLMKRGHWFRTDSDVEVIVHLYEEVGLDCLDRLEGMFGLAIWDRETGRLALARDPLGIKPLYYARCRGGLLFGSEIKALLASGLVSRTIDAHAAAELLSVQGIAAPRTILEGVSAIRPGHVLVVSRERGVELERPYWELAYRPPDPRLRPAEVVAVARDALLRSVRAHLQADVPAGIFLSGGIDSAALVAAARQSMSGRLPTFTVGFDDEDAGATSELAAARETAEHFGTEHHELVLTGRDCAAHLEDAVDALDQPSLDGLNSFFVSRLAAGSVRVALSGIGSDELLLGYRRDAALVSAAAAQDRFHSLSARQRRTVSCLLARLPASLQTHGLETAIDGLIRPERIASRFFGAQGIGLFTEAELSELLVPPAATLAAGVRPGRLNRLLAPGPEPLAAALSRLELFGYASPVLLRDMDAMSMRHSLEVRVPFLDRRFVEWTFGLPLRWKLRRGAGKAVLREAVRPWMPASIIQRPKLGFGLPLGAWMRGELRPLVRDVLGEASIRRHELIRPEAAAALMTSFDEGHAHLEHRLWMLLVVHLWLTRSLEASTRAYEPAVSDSDLSHVAQPLRVWSRAS